MNAWQSSKPGVQERGKEYFDFSLPSFLTLPQAVWASWTHSDKAKMRGCWQSRHLRWCASECSSKKLLLTAASGNGPLLTILEGLEDSKRINSVNWLKTCANLPSSANNVWSWKTWFCYQEIMVENSMFLRLLHFIHRLVNYLLSNFHVI